MCAGVVAAFAFGRYLDRYEFSRRLQDRPLAPAATLSFLLRLR